MPRHGWVVAIEGPSGAGKSTLTRVLARSHEWVRLPEAFDRLRPRPALAFNTPDELLRIEEVLLGEECRRYQDALRKRAQGRTVVTDTGFLGPATYTAGLVALGLAPPRVLRTLLSGRGPGSRGSWGALPDLLVYLEVPAPIRRGRAVQDPRRHPAALIRRHEAVGRVERAFYRDLARGRLSTRIRFLGANQTPHVIADEIRRLVLTLEPAGPSEKVPTELVKACILRVARRQRPRRSTPVSRHR